MAAIRQEELRGEVREALVYDFPTTAVRRRVAREREVLHLRRRIALACMLALVVVASALALRGGAAEVTSRPGAPRQVRLRDGMTLWEVAQRYAPPGSDPRAYVDAVLELNALDAPPPPRARIKLPRSS